MPYSTINDFYAYCPADFVVEFTDDKDSFGFVDYAGGYAQGATNITFAGFASNLADGVTLKFGNHDTLYSASITGQTATISPPLTTAVADRETIKSLGVLNAVNYESARDYSDAILDSYLIKTYPLPFATTPALLVGLSVRMTLYELKRRRNILTEADVKLREEDIKLLENIRDGVIGIDATITPFGASIGFKVSEQTIKFTRDLLNGLR